MHNRSNRSSFLFESCCLSLLWSAVTQWVMGTILGGEAPQRVGCSWQKGFWWKRLWLSIGPLFIHLPVSLPCRPQPLVQCPVESPTLRAKTYAIRLLVFKRTVLCLISVWWKIQVKLLVLLNHRCYFFLNVCAKHHAMTFTDIASIWSCIFDLWSLS